jgi:hypothetical protein
MLLIWKPESHLVLLHTISCRWRIQLPSIVSNSIRILSDGGLGMAMFSLGVHFNNKLQEVYINKFRINLCNYAF